MTPVVHNLINESRRLIKLCEHAVDVGDALALVDMALEAQKRLGRLHEEAKREALRQARKPPKRIPE